MEPEAATRGKVRPSSSVFLTEMEHISGFQEPKPTLRPRIRPFLACQYRLRGKAELLEPLLCRNPSINSVYFAPYDSFVLPGPTCTRRFRWVSSKSPAITTAVMTWSMKPVLRSSWVPCHPSYVESFPVWSPLPFPYQWFIGSVSLASFSVCWP